MFWKSLCFSVSCLIFFANASLGMDQFRRFFEEEILEKRFQEAAARRQKSDWPQDLFSLVPRSSNVASCREIDFSQDDQPPDNINLSASSSVPSITLEDCRDALKKYPNHKRLVLEQDEKTGGISIVGAPAVTAFFVSQKEAEENRAALQTIKNLIIECARSYGKPSVNYHPMLLYRIHQGDALDSETLRRILYSSTGSIHGDSQDKDYEYQACLADPTRGAVEDFPACYITDHDFQKTVTFKLETAISAGVKIRDKFAGVRLKEEDPNERYKKYALHENERSPLLDPQTKKPNPGIK